MLAHLPIWAIVIIAIYTLGLGFQLAVMAFALMFNPRDRLYGGWRGLVRVVFWFVFLVPEWLGWRRDNRRRRRSV